MWVLFVGRDTFLRLTIDVVVSRHPVLECYIIRLWRKFF